jgi:hypothetical protein
MKPCFVPVGSRIQFQPVPETNNPHGLFLHFLRGARESLGWCQEMFASTHFSLTASTYPSKPDQHKGLLWGSAPQKMHSSLSWSTSMIFQALYISSFTVNLHFSITRNMGAFVCVCVCWGLPPPPISGKQ